MSYKAICFDIDGTLYPIGVMNRRILRLSVLHPVFGVKYRKNRHEFRRCQGAFTQKVPLRWREAMILQNEAGDEPSKPFCEDDYRGTYDKLQRCIYAPMRRLYAKTKTFDGVAKTLSAIRAKGLKVGVFTDFPLFDNKLEGLGIAHLVDFAASSDDVGYLKPDTHCLQYLLYNLKMDAKDVLYVGDSYDKDILGSHAAGIDAVLVNVRRSDLADSAKRYPLAKAVFCTWSDFDAWLMANMGED